MKLFDSLKEYLKLYIFILVLLAGAGVYMFDQPVHSGYVEATVITTPSGNPITNDHTTMYATLDNGAQVHVKNIFRVTPEPGSRVKIEQRTRPLIGFNEYQFVEYIE